jgi:hypothetical protein
MDFPVNVKVDERIPKMSASSAVFPTARIVGDALILAFHLPPLDSSAVIRFQRVSDWTYGPPNDEGLDSHPLWGRGITFYEFHISPADRNGKCCWIATFHDGTLTINAKTVEVLAALLPLEPWAAIDSVFGAGENRRLDG